MNDIKKNKLVENKFFILLYPLASVLWGLIIAYVIYFIARVTFFLENLNLFADMAFDHILELFTGGILFDTSAILYTNALWIVLLLLPFHYKETKTWYLINMWLYVVLNVACLILTLWIVYISAIQYVVQQQQYSKSFQMKIISTRSFMKSH